MDYPYDDLPPRKRSWWLAARTITGGPSLSGLVQTANTTGGGFWRAVLEVFLHPANIAIARGLDAQLDGGVTSIVVRAPAEEPTRTAEVASPQTGYLDSNVQGSVQLCIDRTNLDSENYIRPGTHFTIVHDTLAERLYRVVADLEHIGSIQVVEVRPPLREDVDPATEVDFAEPRCLMRLADPESFRVDEEVGGADTGFAMIAPQFMEHFE